MQPKLYGPNDEVLADTLTGRELEQLAALGVEIDVDAEDATDGDGGGDANPDAPIDDIAEMLDEMEQAADEDAAGSWWDAGDADDYSEADDIDERRLDELHEKLAESKSDIGQAKQEREDRDVNPYWTGDDVRREVQNSELLDELTAALRKLTTRDHDFPDTTGHTLNIDAVVRQRAGAFNEKNLYLNRKRAESGDRSVSVALDLSGSMDELAAKKALAALAEATEVIGDEFMAVGFTQTRAGGDGAYTPLITAPDEEFTYDHLDTVTTGGGTPTPDGIKAGAELLNHASKPEKLVIVVTDGKARTCLQDGESTGEVEKDVRKVIHAARESGAKVIGLGIDNAEDEYMAKLFGDDYVTARMGRLVDALIDVYRRQLSTTAGGF